MPAPIRVGLIRCDTHGMWFGPQMMNHDSVLFERPCCYEDDCGAKYSWMTRGGHYFFYTHYSSPRQMTAPRVEGFEIVKLWDEDRHVAELASKIFYGKPTVCDTFEQVSEDVDLVFIADCNGDGSDHIKLASPGLERGIATFIDKPFADTLEHALQIEALATKHHAPLLSLSILQTNPATTRFARRLEEVGRTDFGTVTCYGLHPAALIHAISIVHHVFGVGVHSVHTVTQGKHTTIHLDYGDRPDRPKYGVNIMAGAGDFRFTEMFITAYGPEGAILGQAMNDFDASSGSAIILEHVRDMVHTRKPHPLHRQMIEGIALMDAITESVKLGEAITVTEIPK